MFALLVTVFLGPVQTSIFSCAELNTNFGRPKWYKFDGLLRLRTQLVGPNSFSRCSMVYMQCLPVKVNFSNLCIRFSNMWSSTFETNSPLSRNSHLGHSILIHRLTQIRHVDLFKHFIEEVRFGTWKGCCRLNWALTPSLSILAMFVCRVKQSKHSHSIYRGYSNKRRM